MHIYSILSDYWQISGIESRTLMFHLVKSRQDQSGLSAVWRKKKKEEFPQRSRRSKSTAGCLHIRRKNLRGRGGWSSGGLGDWQTRCSLYWTGVPLPWQPAAPGWYLERQVELLQRISCSAHIWEVSSHGAVVFARHPSYFRLIRSSGVIISQISRSCAPSQQPVLLNYRIHVIVTAI